MKITLKQFVTSRIFCATSLFELLIKLSIFQSLSLWILNCMAEGIPGI